MDKQVKVIRSELLSTKQESRYVVVNQETGEIIDNAQGYGYKTRQKAYVAYSYKTRDKSKDQERKNRFDTNDIVKFTTV